MERQQRAKWENAPCIRLVRCDLKLFSSVNVANLKQRGYVCFARLSFMYHLHTSVQFYVNGSFVTNQMKIATSWKSAWLNLFF